MNLKFIDFSDIYYGSITKKVKPRKRKGKFIQLRNNKTEYLILAPISLSPFHANILERFCLTNGIYGRYTNSKMEKFEIEDFEWEVVGGGHWEMDDDKKILVLSGASYVYGRFAPSRLREKIRAVDALKGYRITIK
ncbi:MAG: hypothetical protein VST71_03185 [Nitrospirota bacterium]|nr:hypothetical protein [Nitrospirota bacterium]